MGNTLKAGDYAYRIFDSKGDRYMSLFHGTQGSRTIPMNKWVDADVMQVRNPGTSKNYFKSGWHVTPSLEEAAGYLTNFSSKASQNYVLAKVQVDGEVRPKPRARANVWLAEKMKIVEIIDATTTETVYEGDMEDAFLDAGMVDESDGFGGAEELMDISPMEDDEYRNENKRRIKKRAIKTRKIRSATKQLDEMRKVFTRNMSRLDNVSHNQNYINTDDRLGEIVMIKIDNSPRYLRRIDSNHLFMVDSLQEARIKHGNPDHVSQYEDTDYYQDISEWLDGTISATDLNGKSYK